MDLIANYSSDEHSEMLTIVQSRDSNVIHCEFWGTGVNKPFEIIYIFSFGKTKLF